MSRSKKDARCGHNTKGNRELWSRRAQDVGKRSTSFGRYTKTITHRGERRRDRRIVQERLVCALDEIQRDFADSVDDSPDGGSND